MQADHSKITSGENQTYWLESQPAKAFEKLQRDAQTDVVIVGAGISGLTTAYNLLRNGKKVMVLDDGFIGSGESGRTTAHLTCALDDRYYEIENMLGKEASALAAQSHMEAIKFIENTVKLENIDCRYRTVDGYLFLHPTDKKETLEKEYAALKSAGIMADMVAEVPGIILPDGQQAIRFPGQGQFHIMEYLNGLARAIESLGGIIHTESRVAEIDKYGVKANGCHIYASHIVVATNSPINNIFIMHTKQSAYRTYVVAARVEKGKLPYALWWDSGDQQSKWNTCPYHYVRLEEGKDCDWLIVGGEDHKTGQGDDEGISEEGRYDRLKAWTVKHFPDVESFEYHWSGQVLEPVDLMAFIGKNPGDENIFIITGDSGNGMTHGTLGGIIITDLILERENPYQKLYDPSRITWGAARYFAEENVNVAAQYFDWLGKDNVDKVSEIAIGDGAVIASGFDRYAVYRDKMGALHAHSAVCPHLGCIVQWNGDEKSWDCPCHGSRFSTDGKVLNGPAITDLKKVSLSNNT